MLCSPSPAVTLNTPVGLIIIESCEDGIHSVHVPESKVESPEASIYGKVSISDGQSDDFTVLKCVEWFTSYFRGTILDMNLPLCSQGTTSFMQDTYKALSAIKPGDTISYGELGRKAGKCDSARAVGSCMAKNRHVIIVPCHRVVHSCGKLSKYSIKGHLKQALLLHEASIARSSPKREHQGKAVLAPKSQVNSDPEPQTQSKKTTIETGAENENVFLNTAEVKASKKKTAKKAPVNKSCPRKRKLASRTNF